VTDVKQQRRGRGGPLAATAALTLATLAVSPAASAATVRPLDGAPPSRPAGICTEELTGESGVYLTLSWAPSTDDSNPSDRVHYRVWEAEGSARPLRETAEGVTEVTFHERQGPFWVSAVDPSGNESLRNGPSSAC
jgi:hypothetical protein